MKRILVVAAHPDDEILGCGGTIKRLIDEGGEAYALILSDGVTSRSDGQGGSSASHIASRQGESMKAARKIGFKEIYFGSFPDNMMDALPLLDIIKVVEKYMDEIKPNIVFTHHYGDLNIDHRITFQAVITAARPAGDCTVDEIYSFETLSSTEWDFSYSQSFEPNVFFDIEKTFPAKIEAMKCYKSELREYPHPRSEEAIEAAAKKWGSVVGCKMAEAFELIRKVER